MFNDVFDRVTGLFDRRALISTFFPSLVFWLLTIIIVAIPQVGWNNALTKWNTLNGTIQALLLIAFFAWIVFWSFLILNFRTSMVRLYEGYWPTSGLSAILLRLRRKRWQKRWDKLDSKDQELEAEEGTLLSEKKGYEDLPKSLKQSGTSQLFFAEEQQAGRDLEEFLKGLEVELKGYKRNVPSSSILQTLGEKTRTWWQQITLGLTEEQRTKDPSWANRCERLQSMKEQLEELTDQQFNKAQEQRLSLDRDLFLYYPTKRDDVMPTRLGNVLKAAETYTRERYHLDSVLIWSRLQFALPKEFTDSLQDVETSLTLMIILSTSIILFGIPLSIWSTFKLFLLLPWWLPLVLGLVSFLLQFYVLSGLALIALILTIVPYFIPHPPPTFITQIQFLMVILVGVLFLARLSYQNAVQTALDYGGKIKTAFDLYRWKVLEELHLELPSDYEEEQKIWQQVCELLYRAYPPDAHYYRYVQKGQVDDSASSAS